MPSSEFGQLLQGERIVWSGQPRQGFLFMPMDMVIVPISALWLAFAIYWQAGLLSSGAPPGFELFGLPFILTGVYFFAGRFFIDAWLRQNTRYAVTTLRILIVRDGVFPGYVSVYLDRVPQMDIAERPNGFGTIRFGRPLSFWNYNRDFGHWLPALDPTPQFLRIAEARNVYNRIQRLMPQQTIPA